MHTPTSPVRRTGVALFLILFALLPGAPATADVPERDTTSHINCLLERIGTQLVRCDDLTGAGVDAPYWIPEQK